MISRLTGKIVYKNDKHIIIDVNGVGYKVATTIETMMKNEGYDKNITLWTYLAVRENAMDLYGFNSIVELNFFELLITISGIGPKTALGILNVASVNALETAIKSNDTSHLTKVSGIGKKIAEKIVLELKDKIEDIEGIPETDNVGMKNDGDVIEALKSLGYNPYEAREALKKVPKDKEKTSDKIKEALKILNK